MNPLKESVNEAFVVAYGKGPKPIKPAFAAYADKKMAQKFMADMKKDGYKVMMTQKKIRGIDEGQKRYNQKDGVGKSKYVISYHDGKKKHKDGSDFFDMQIFRNKKDLAKFVNALHKGGYKYGFGESVNENFTKEQVYYGLFKFKHKGKKYVGQVVRNDGSKLILSLDDIGLLSIPNVSPNDMEYLGNKSEQGKKGLPYLSGHPKNFKKVQNDKFMKKLVFKGGLTAGLPSYLSDSTLKDINKYYRLKLTKDDIQLESLNEVSDSEIKKSIKKKERGGPYTIIARNGNRIVAHSPKSYDKVQDAIKMYHKLNKKHGRRSSVSIEDGYGRTVFMESINEASREAMGIAGFTGTRGSAVQKFIDDYNLNARKLFNFVKKGKLKDRLDFVTAIAGKPGNKFQGKMVGMFGEGNEDGVPQGYNPMVESKTKESKVIQVMYKYSKTEKKFYDKMAEHERRIGPRDYAKFIIMALKGFGINPREFKRVPDAEEKLYQTVSKK